MDTRTDDEDPILEHFTKQELWTLVRTKEAQIEHERRQTRSNLPPWAILFMLVTGGYVATGAYLGEWMAVWIARVVFGAWILGWVWAVLITFGPQKEWPSVQWVDRRFRWFLGLHLDVDR